jgi:acyl-CoA thioesterase-2
VLNAQQSPSAQGGRGMRIGRKFSAEGTLEPTFAQEGMLRIKES